MDFREPLDRLICLFFPPRCLGCDKVVGYEDMFCADCGYERTDAEACRKKLGDVRVSGAIAGTLYTGGIRKAVWRIKDKQDIRVINFFAETMLQEIKSNWTAFAPDYVTPVPLSAEKLKTRGFNQAGLLAKALAGLLHAPYAEAVLMQDNDAQIQHMLNLRQREENARKSFHIAAPGFVKGKTILLVDDVLTSGATLRVCAGLLLRDGAQAVYVAAASRTPDSAPKI